MVRHVQTLKIILFPDKLSKLLMNDYRFSGSCQDCRTHMLPHRIHDSRCIEVAFLVKFLLFPMLNKVIRDAESGYNCLITMIYHEFAHRASKPSLDGMVLHCNDFFKV